MVWRKQKSTKQQVRTTRQRLQQADAKSNSVTPLKQTYNYFARRSEPSNNTGRKFRNEVLQPAVKQVGNFWLQRFGLAVLLIVGLICLVSIVTVNPNVKVVIANTPSQNTSFHNQLAYQTAANKILASSVFNRTKVTLDTVKLRRQLLASYPELANVTVTLPILSHRPILYVTYTQPAVILQNRTSSYLLDTNGKVLSATTDAALHKQLPVVTDQSGLKLQINHQVLPSTDISFMQTITNDLSAKQLSASAMTLPAAANELDVSISGKPYYVKFNLHETDINQQVGAFLAVSSRLQTESITPTKYIDVRVEGRAYYL